VKADPATEAEILAICERGTRSLDGGSLDGYFESVAPDDDVVLYGTGADEKLVGRDCIPLRVPRQIEETRASSTRIDWYSVSLSSDRSVAWVSMDCTQSIVMGGSYIAYPLRFTGVLERREGRWMFVQQHSSIPGHPEGTSHPTALDAVVSSVALERPELRPHAGKDGTVTLLFTDIENSTQMALRLGDTGWMEALRYHNAVVRRHALDLGGVEVKSQGDGFMLAFTSPLTALRAAIQIQLEFDANNRRNPGEPIRVRMGAHTGSAIEEDNDFFGETVIFASRVAALARPAEILVSADLRIAMGGCADLSFGQTRAIELKGFPGHHDVYPLHWAR
jgi:class 3 adenylate cyclase